MGGEPAHKVQELRPHFEGRRRGRGKMFKLAFVPLWEAGRPCERGKKTERAREKRAAGERIRGREEGRAGEGMRELFRAGLWRNSGRTMRAGKRGRRMAADESP